MNTTKRTPRGAAIVSMALATALCIAACGSASSSSSSSTAAKVASAGTSTGRAALAACLKQHGVTLPSRPGGFRPGGGAGAPGAGPAAGARRGGGFFGGGAPGGHFNSKFAAAFKACGAKFGAGAGGRFRRGAAFSHAKITQYVTCIRQHGYAMPSPNFSGKGSVFPAKIRTNKKFLAASKSCTSILVPARPGGAGTTPTTSSS